MKVLLVEDDVELRLCLASSLSASGFTVTEAGSGDEGLKLITEHAQEPFSFICTDFNMPGLDGISMIFEAHKVGLNSKIVVILSGRGIYDPIVTDLASKDLTCAIHFLEKPFSLEKFENLILRVRKHLTPEGVT